MNLRARPYENTADYARMQQLLIAGRQAKIGSYYVHPGDLDWWMHYPPNEDERRRDVLVWEREGDGVLAAWSLMKTDEGSFDLFVQPHLHGTASHQTMLDESLAWAEARAKAAGLKQLQSYWIADTDVVTNALLAARGFVAESALSPLFERSLDTVPSVTLPAGFAVHGVTSLDVGRQRAEATHGAFGAHRPWDAYWAKYQQFMHSAAYDGERDLVVVSPEGRGASGCVIWFDPVNAVGLFEPVGTHPDFQRRGLGKALMTEGMRRMKAAGMRTAIVGTIHSNVAGCALYQSMGFRVAFGLANWKREVGT